MKKFEKKSEKKYEARETWNNVEDDLDKLCFKLSQEQGESNLKEIGEKNSKAAPFIDYYKGYIDRIMLYKKASCSVQFVNIEVSEKLIIKEINSYLILNQCMMISRKMEGYSQEYYLIELNNFEGSTKILFDNQEQFTKWKKVFKKKCSRTQFYQKYKIIDEMMKDFYVCEKKSNGQKYFFKIIYNKDVIRKSEAIDKEITLLQNMRGQTALKFKQIYQEKSGLFLLYEYFIGTSLLEICYKNIQLNEVQIGEIIHQLLGLIQRLDSQGQCHGQLLPENIFIDLGSEEFKIVATNFCIQDQNLPKAFQSKRYNGIRNDLYQLGVLLYFISTFSFQKYQQVRKWKNSQFMNKEFIYSENFTCDPKSIDEQIKYFKNIRVPHSKIINTYPQLYSLEQAQFIKSLILEPQKNVTSAFNDIWFLNLQTKVNNTKNQGQLSIFAANKLYYEENLESLESEREFVSSKIQSLFNGQLSPCKAQR